jgi:hypothetical protein
MKTYDFDSFDACDLEKILQAGNNITITKIDNCTLEISSSGGGGANNGIKYHLKSGDNIVVEDFFQYYLYCNFILDNGSIFTINSEGQLVVDNGIITNDSIIVNDGIIKNIC